MIEAIDPRVDMHIVDVQTLILAVSPTPVFKQIFIYKCYQMEVICSATGS